MRPLPYGSSLATDAPTPLAPSSGAGRLVRQLAWLLVAAVFITADWLIAVREKSRPRTSRGGKRR